MNFFIFRDKLIKDEFQHLAFLSSTYYSQRLNNKSANKRLFRMFRATEMNQQEKVKFSDIYLGHYIAATTQLKLVVRLKCVDI